MPPRRTTATPELREELIAHAHRCIDVEQQWCDIAGLADTERIDRWRQRITDLEAGHAVVVSTDDLAHVLHRIGDGRWQLVSGPRVN